MFNISRKNLELLILLNSDSFEQLALDLWPTLALVMEPKGENSLRSFSSSMVSSRFLIYRFTPCKHKYALRTCSVSGKHIKRHTHISLSTWYLLILSCLSCSNFLLSSACLSIFFWARPTNTVLPFSSEPFISSTAWGKNTIVIYSFRLISIFIQWLY